MTLEQQEEKKRRTFKSVAADIETELVDLKMELRSIEKAEIQVRQDRAVVEGKIHGLELAIQKLRNEE